MLETIENVVNLAYLYPDHPLLEVIQDRERTIANLRRQVVEMEHVLLKLRRQERMWKDGSQWRGDDGVSSAAGEWGDGDGGDNGTAQPVRVGDRRGASAG